MKIIEKSIDKFMKKCFVKVLLIFALILFFGSCSLYLIRYNEAPDLFKSTYIFEEIPLNATLKNVDISNRTIITVDSFSIFSEKKMLAINISVSNDYNESKTNIIVMGTDSVDNLVYIHKKEIRMLGPDIKSYINAGYKNTLIDDTFGEYFVSLPAIEDGVWVIKAIHKKTPLIGLAFLIVVISLVLSVLGVIVLAGSILAIALVLFTIETIFNIIVCIIKTMLNLTNLAFQKRKEALIVIKKLLKRIFQK